MWKWLIILSLYSGVVMSSNKIPRHEKVQKWVIDILNKHGASRAFKAGTLGNIERETAFRFFSNESGEKSYGIMQHNLSNNNQRGRRFAQYMREKGFPNFKSDFKNFNNLSEEKAKKLIQSNMEYAFIEQGESSRLNNVLHSEDVQEVASAYAAYERFRDWNNESSSYKVKHRDLSQKHYDRLSQEQSTPTPLTIQGTPETTAGVLQQETPKLITEMFQPIAEKEELTQLRKEQEPEFTPDPMNEILSQGGQSQEVMTRKPKSYDEMSFRNAFNQAWRDKGEGDVFNWKGKPYLLKRK